VVTWAIIVVCVIVFVLQLLPGSTVTEDLAFYPPFSATEPWRMLTTMFVHSQNSFLHILLNMVSLYLFGPIVERLLGRLRYLALYLLSGFGGSVAVLLIAPDTPVVGASGAIFGLLGAFFVIARRLGGNSSQVLIVIIINLGIGFLPGTNIAWQAHLGGLITGAAVALVYLLTRRTSQRRVQALGVAAIFAALIALTIVGVNLL
jgi:membrane associated rhomboid family serine protease